MKLVLTVRVSGEIDRKYFQRQICTCSWQGQTHLRSSCELPGGKQQAECSTSSCIKFVDYPRDLESTLRMRNSKFINPGGKACDYCASLPRTQECSEKLFTLGQTWMEPKRELRGILKDVGNAGTGTTHSGNHPPFIDLIIEAIEELKERKGSSKQSIVKYILSRYDLVGAGRFTEKQFSGNLNRALRRGVTNSTLLQISGTGASGRFKLANKKMVNSVWSSEGNVSSLSPQTSRRNPRPSSRCNGSVSLRPRRKVHWNLPSYCEPSSSDEGQRN